MRLYYCIFFLCCCLFSYGQIQYCGTTSQNLKTETFSTVSNDCSWCDDLPSIIENCDEIWVNVTMHFISNDDCSSDIQYQWAGSDGWDNTTDADDAIARAQAMFDEANALLEGMNQSLNWGMDCHDLYGGGEPYTEAICMPLRFRFAGVEFHCVEEFSDPSNFPLFLSNDDDHFHVTFVEFPGDGNGMANTHTSCLIENFSGDLLTHEILHNLGLSHSGAGHATGCDDLPKYPEDLEWYNPFTNQTETTENCYNDNPTYYDDAYGITYDLCDQTIVNHNTHPCCDPCNHSNNTMSYSSFNNTPGIATLTPCQINKAMNKLCGSFCHLIDSVIPQDGCPPATAFAFQPPQMLYEFEECQMCFVLSASDYTSAYSISLVDNSGNPLYNGPWITEKPKSFCIDASSDNSWEYGIESNSSYTFVLEVRNKCGDYDRFTLDFDTPENCDGLSDPCFYLEPEIISSNIITINSSTWQREICWKDVEAEYYEVTYEIEGQGSVTTIVSGTCFTSPLLNDALELLSYELSVESICDCSDDPPIFELGIDGNPCNSETQLCLNFEDEQGNEYYEIEWIGPDGVIALTQNGPTCIPLTPDMPDGKYYANITFYWGPKYKKVKCESTSDVFSKNCNCPETLSLNYNIPGKGSPCKSDFEICAEDNYGYLDLEDKYYTIEWFIDGNSTGISYNGSPCITVPAGTSEIVVVVTYYSGPKYDRAYCRLKESSIFNCDCPNEINFVESEENCKKFCLETIPEGTLVSGYYTLSVSSFEESNHSYHNGCFIFWEEGDYTVTIKVYADLEHEYLLCTFTETIRVRCGFDEGSSGGIKGRRYGDQIGNTILAYPNPIVDKLSIESAIDLNGTMIIYDALGKVAWSQKINIQKNEPIQISTQDMKAGVYYISVVGTNGKQFNTKIIKLD